MVKTQRIGQSATKLLMRTYYTLDSNFFETINTERKAYWLGFIQADGAIDGPRENQLRIKIQKSDRVLLERFAKDIGYNGPIIEKLNYCKINITSKKLTDDLKKLGIVRNKTFKTSYLSFPNLQGHYFRGLFDGDGCACYYIDKKKRHVLCVSIVANHQTANQIKDSFLSNLNVDIRLQDKTTVAELQTTKYINLKTIYKFMYTGSDGHLERKKDKFDSYFLHKNDAQRL